MLLLHFLWQKEREECLCSWQFLSGFCHYDNNGEVRRKKIPLSHIYSMDKLKFWLKFDTIVLDQTIYWTLLLLILLLLLYSVMWECISPSSHTLCLIFSSKSFLFDADASCCIAFTNLWKYKNYWYTADIFILSFTFIHSYQCYVSNLLSMMFCLNK